ncbi:MAG: homing endonuclease associated repeat-containing protein [Pirellulaceae bacterium]
MQFQLEDFHRNIPNDELIADLRRVDEVLRSQDRTLSIRTYAEVGKFSAGTFADRFGSWNSALAAAGLSPNHEKNVSLDVLFDNLRVVWVAKGRQPVFRDMATPPSRYNGQLYATRFGSWRNALHEFVAIVNSDDWVASDEDLICEPISTSKNADFKKRRTSRSISERMRFRILLRDGFSCQSCGASPLQDRGVELHVDHVLPWSKGGETEEANLQTKCERCNLGKGNAFDK